MGKPEETALTPELYCTDIKISLNFYTDILGFNIQYQRSEEYFAMLERQGSRIMLDQVVPGSKRSWITASLERPFGRGINLQMVTTNIQDLYDPTLCAIPDVRAWQNFLLIFDTEY